MFRKLVAITLLISFLAMSTSGLMMFFINQTSFTLQMHPVHKLFGLLMVIAAISHIILNFKNILNHLQNKWVAAVGSVLVVILVLLYGVALNHSVPPELATQLDNLAKEAEQQAEGEK